MSAETPTERDARQKAAAQQTIAEKQAKYEARLAARDKDLV